MRSRRSWIATAPLILLVVVSAVVFWPSTSTPADQPVPVPVTVAQPPAPPTAFERSAQVLTAQAAALLAGDEQGWLAGLDPGQPQLRRRYETIFRNLRALDVTQLEYRAYPRAGGRGPVTTVSAHLTYCLSSETCPAEPPRITLDLDFRRVAGRYVITRLATPAGRDRLQPTPWQDARLSVVHGRRVTVAGPRSQARHLREVLAAAEKASVVADRFAAYLHNRQQRYRIYLADEKSWTSWYGGSDRRWWVGYAVPLNSAGTDVVLRAAKLVGDPEQLAVTVQHELGHVATLAGAQRPADEAHGWLTEGIAEYIGAYPRTAGDSHSRYGLRRAFGRGDGLRTVVARSLTPRSSARSVDAFYSLGHYAATCMAEKFGERELLAFVSLVLRYGQSLADASLAAYGRPFTAVDRDCVTWIRGQLT